MVHDHSVHSHNGHDHGAPRNYNFAFGLGILLNTAFVCVEAFYGWASGSLSLLADAGHNAGDVASLILAWFAAYLASRPPSGRRTYGMGRATIMASMVNAMLLFAAVGAIALEAVTRISQPEPVAAMEVVVVAAIGTVINAATALLFLSGSKGDLNIRGAFLHMAADAGVSLGVVGAGLVIRFTGWYLVDPLVSLAISMVIAVTTWGLFRESTQLSLDAVPDSIDRQAVLDHLLGLDGVEALHDLHIWALSTTRVALTAHLVMPQGADDAFLTDMAHGLEETFGIEHVTVQVETNERAFCQGACEWKP